MVKDAVKRIWEDDGCNIGTLEERVVTDSGNGVWECHFRNIRAKVECSSINGCHGIVDSLVGNGGRNAECTGNTGAVAALRCNDLHCVWDRIGCDSVVEGLPGATHGAEVLRLASQGGRKKCKKDNLFFHFSDNMNVSDCVLFFWYLCWVEKIDDDSPQPFTACGW